jgi:hypothetical protein
MRVVSPILVPENHAGLTNVTPGQHHLPPGSIEISNTTLNVPPLPGGPSDWDVQVDDDALAVLFHLRSNENTQPGFGAKAGVIGIATIKYLEASVVSFGHKGAVSTYAAIYAQAAYALNLSHKIFGSVAESVALSDAKLVDSGGHRYFRTTWTNYSAGYSTLQCWGEVGVIG